MKTRILYLAILFILLIGSCKIFCPPVIIPDTECPNPTGLITKEQANDMEELYKTVGWNAINDSLSSSGTPTEDTREAWLSLQEMKDYICYFEHKADSLGYQNLGLRIYFGAKLDSTLTPDTLAAYRSTCFIWPTHVPSAGNGFVIGDPNENADGIKGKDYFGMGKKELNYP